MAYAMQTRVDGDFDEVVERTERALSEEGFGVLSDVDVSETFAEKFDPSFRRYRILGACNPGMAHDALGVADDPELDRVAVDVSDRLHRVLDSL